MTSIVYFLLAAALAVPLFKRFGLGAILGYLVAGLLIGPSIFGLISDPEKVLHFSEIGVIFLLFVIGLELEPKKLWSMKNRVIGLGAGQLTVTAFCLYVLFHYLFQVTFALSVVIAIALALSSTAFAIQLMADKGLLGKTEGRNGFSILLFQDLMVVPILFLTEVLSPNSTQNNQEAWWLAPLVISGLILFAKYLVNPVLRFMARHGGREIMTVVALLIVLGSAQLMQIAGLSAGMGAFMAGMMLANSSFRHQLEADVEPFKGLTLGLFFISVGMTLNLSLIVDSPFIIIFGMLGLMILKAAIITGLCLLAKMSLQQSVCLGVLLSQGGEFAFVIVAHAQTSGLMDANTSSLVSLVVGLSMVATAPFLNQVEKLLGEDSIHPINRASHDTRPIEEPEILILGFGRFSQVTARILSAHQIPFLAVDKDPQHIEFVKKFGSKVFYGDASRTEILEAAGLARAKVVLVGLNHPTACLEVVRYIRKNHPKIQIVTRAHNRNDYLTLKEAGAQAVIRELFSSSVEASYETLRLIGFADLAALEATNSFREHDLEMLEENLKATMANKEKSQEEKPIYNQSLELETLFNKDQSH